MKKAFLQRFKFIVPILILVLGISFVFVFEFYVKDKVNTVPVVVANRDIPFKKQITREDLTIKQVNKDYLISETFRPDELESLIGTYASIEIKAGTQMYPQLVDEYDLVPNEELGEFIAPIPSEWLFAVPGTLKRSYIADFYVIGNNDVIIDEMINELEQQQNSQTEGENDEQNNETPIQEQENITSYVKSSYEPILKDVRVAHVRDGSNQEITKNPESNDPNSATSNISSIEIIATNETLAAIREYIDKGFKLYITYDYERSDKTDSNQETEKE